MSQSITVKVDLSGIDPWKETAERATRAAASKAGGDAVRAMRAEGSRQIRVRKAVKVPQLGKALIIEFPTSKDVLLWRVRASGAPMPVAAFPFRPTKRGVSVLINVGGRTVIPHAFSATLKSGHVGVFKREGKTRLPIRELYTTRVSEVFGDAIPAVAKRGEDVFRATFTRLLPLEASNLGLTRST